MYCVICKHEIKHYSQEFNQLTINEQINVEICQDCIDKFIKWQQRKFAKLLPTKALKKMYLKE